MLFCNDFKLCKRNIFASPPNIEYYYIIGKIIEIQYNTKLSDVVHFQNINGRKNIIDKNARDL